MSVYRFDVDSSSTEIFEELKETERPFLKIICKYRKHSGIIPDIGDVWGAAL